MLRQQFNELETSLVERYINCTSSRVLPSGEKRVKGVCDNPSQSYRASPVIWITQCYLPPDTGKHAPH